MTSKGKFSLAALFSAAVLGGAFFVNNSTVNAAEHNYSQAGNAYVSFSDGTSGPVDTSDPKNSDGSNVPPATSDTGNLALLAIPTSFNFGNNKLEAGEMNLPLVPSSDGNIAKADAQGTDGKATTDTLDKDGDPAVATQVKNYDPDGPEWTLSATLNAFDNGAGATLDGATITLDQGEQQIVDKDTSGTDVWTKESDLGGGSITLEQGTANTYLKSKDKGITQQIWKDSNVHLVVPAGVAAQTGYTATIDWKLSAPAVTPES